MKTSYITNSNVENLPKISRVIRGMFGAGLIAFVLTTPAAPLGWYAILPLLAIYPIFTAITGWDPIKAFFQHPWITHRALQFSNPVRYAVGAIGVALIGSVYVASYFGTSLGLLAILPILGIYPVFAAIAGMDPITALYNMDNTSVESKETKTEVVPSQQRPAVFALVSDKKPASPHREKKTHGKAA